MGTLSAFGPTDGGYPTSGTSLLTESAPYSPGRPSAPGEEEDYTHNFDPFQAIPGLRGFHLSGGAGGTGQIS